MITCTDQFICGFRIRGVWMELVFRMNRRHPGQNSHWPSGYYKVNQKFCNILEHASLWYIYHMIKSVEAVERTCCGW